jgi:phage head maturation protease
MYLDNVKAKLTIEDNIIKGYAVVFDSVDLQGEKFTKSTYFGELDVMRPILMYNHGLDSTFKRVPIGNVTKFIKDDYGIYFEAELKALNPDLWKQQQLEDSKSYLEAIKDLIKSGVLGVSSGAVAHGVIKSNSTIEQWPFGEISVTTQPAEPKTFIKSDVIDNTIETNLNTQIEVKAGRVLSQKNYDRLKTIKTIIDEIDSEIESKLEAMQEKEKLQSGLKPETKNDYRNNHENMMLFNALNDDIVNETKKENYFDVKELELEINNIIKGALYGRE